MKDMNKPEKLESKLDSDLADLKQDRMISLIEGLTQESITIESSDALINHLQERISNTVPDDDINDLKSIVDLIEDFQEGNDTDDQVSITVKARGKMIEHLDMEND